VEHDPTPVTGQQLSGFIAAGTKPATPTIDPTNRFLYAADQGANSILEFSIDSSTGNLTAMGSFTTPATPYAIAISTPVWEWWVRDVEHRHGQERCTSDVYN
jgi:hypothetical protein